MDNFSHNSMYLEMATLLVQTAVLLTKHDSFYVDDERFMEEEVYPQIIEKLEAAEKYLEMLRFE